MKTASLDYSRSVLAVLACGAAQGQTSSMFSVGAEDKNMAATIKRMAKAGTIKIVGRGKCGSSPVVYVTAA